MRRRIDPSLTGMVASRISRLVAFAPRQFQRINGAARLRQNARRILSVKVARGVEITAPRERVSAMNADSPVIRRDAAQTAPAHSGSAALRRQFRRASRQWCGSTWGIAGI